MRLMVVCDAGGAVVSAATWPEGGLRLSSPDLAAGHREVEIDAPEIAETLDQQEIHRRLGEKLGARLTP